MVRVKRQGKSLPLKWQHLRHCKPQPEARPNRNPQAARLGFGQVARALWRHIAKIDDHLIQNPAYRPTHFFKKNKKKCVKVCKKCYKVC